MASDVVTWLRQTSNQREMGREIKNASQKRICSKVGGDVFENALYVWEQAFADGPGIFILGINLPHKEITKSKHPMTWEVLPTLQAAQDLISTFLVKDISPENVTDHSNLENSD